jgi:hypothetical protein
MSVTEDSAESIIRHCSVRELAGRKINNKISTRARG